MQRNFVLVAGALLIFLSAMVGLVIIPMYMTQKATKPAEMQVSREVVEGHEVYISNGCIYCHSQQVRPDGFGADIERGWGQRGSQPQDYNNLTPHVLGTMRTGPDLADIGQRQPSEDWHYIHLFNPRAVVPGSIMPRYPWLFEVVDKDAGQKEGISLPPDYQIPGKKVIPTEKGEALVEYLLSLKQEELEQ